MPASHCNIVRKFDQWHHADTHRKTLANAREIEIMPLDPGRRYVLIKYSERSNSLAYCMDGRWRRIKNVTHL